MNGVAACSFSCKCVISRNNGFAIVGNRFLFYETVTGCIYLSEPMLIAVLILRYPATSDGTCKDRVRHTCDCESATTTCVVVRISSHVLRPVLIADLEDTYGVALTRTATRNGSHLHFAILMGGCFLTGGADQGRLALAAVASLARWDIYYELARVGSAFYTWTAHARCFELISRLSRPEPLRGRWTRSHVS
jgi:hypothetical protein